ncbi:MAG TPA: hypothetical protein VK871_02795 [Candidatus Limnocylindrales bacterium]|nr:hypothetical protein [Candidatus Limnocylindrales bacterium]
MALLTRLPLHPLLFAAYAVLFLYSANLDEVLPVDAVAPLGRSVLGAAGLLVVLALSFRDLRRGALVATALVVAFFGYGHVSGALTDAGADDRTQLAAWGAVAIGTFVYAARAGASLPRVTAGLNVIAAVLVVVATATIVPYEVNRAGRGPISFTATVAARTETGRRPDIYFLVFDRYGSADAIERRFRLGNDIYGWLEERGFQVPANSHANYRATDFSLAATLNMQFLDRLTEEVGRVSGDRTPAQQMIRDHEVGRYLKAQGYSYYQIGSWFGPTRSVPIADENLTLGIASEFESVLSDTTIVPAVERVLGIVSPEATTRDRHREGTLFGLRQLRRVATAPGPKFVFAHILLPHDPYVFRADGSPLPEDEAKAMKERDLYAGHLAFANAQIREIVGYLLAGPEENRPVVIIEGDEGPLACQSVDCVSNTPEYLRIRLGNLVAMYLPGVDYTLPETFTSVNTFRVVFREYFGADLEPLPDRSFTWPDNDHIYDFEDVTDRIAPAAD